MLMSGAKARLAGAVVVLVLLWLAVAWALSASGA